MKKSNFLNKLKKEEKLKLVEPSEEICTSFLIKSNNCTKIAILAYKENIYENAVSEAYYSTYNTIMALFYKCGIKNENHSAAATLLKELYNLDKLRKIFLEFKKDRIDNQYYTPLKNDEMTKEQCLQKLNNAQDMNNQLRTVINKINLEDIKNIRNRFSEL